MYDGDTVAIRRFEDLEVWQAARELASGVCRAADTQPLGKDYALLNQMKRSAVSVQQYRRGI